MKTIAIIPARSGSKRIIDKNIKKLNSRPLIEWTIELALNYNKFESIVVSTDSAEIAKISEKMGVSVPWLRPDNLSTDYVSSVDVCLHAVNWYESCFGNIDAVVLLQPTSPLRKMETIKKGIGQFYSSGGDSSVVAVTRVKQHPMWMFEKNLNKITPFIKGDGLNKRSQDLQELYIISGLLYVSSPKQLRKYKSFIHVDTIPLVIDSNCESLDIDDYEDWQIAEALLKYNLENKN